MEESTTLRVAKDNPLEVDIFKLVEPATKHALSQILVAREGKSARDLSSVGSGSQLVGVLGGNSDLLLELSGENVSNNPYVRLEAR